MEIRKKLLIIIATSILATAIPGGYVMYIYTQRQVIQTASAELEAATVWLAGALEQRIRQHGSEPLSGGFRAFSALSGRYPGTQHILMDPSGNFLHAGTWPQVPKGEARTWKPDPGREPQFAALLASTVSESPVTLRTDLALGDQHYLAIGMQLAQPGWRYYNLTPLDEIKAPSKHLFVVRSTIVLVLLLLGGTAISVAVGNGITRRISLLRDVVHGHARDDALRFPQGLMGNDEIGEVARAYNALADEVERNIAQRMQAQDQLSSSEETWRLALEGAGYGVWDWNLPADTVAFSQRSQDMLGVPAHIVRDVQSAWLSRIHPDDRADATHVMREHLFGGATSYAGEYRVSMPDGTFKWLLNRGRVVSRDADGKPIRVIGTHTDISARKALETSLANSKLLLQTVLRAMPDLLWLKDVDGRYLACNKRFEQFFGAPESAILNKTDYDFIDKDLADFFRANDQAAVAAGGLHRNEEWITFAADGHRELLETTKLPVKGTHGELLGVLGIGHDVTHSRQMADALKQREQYLRALLDTLPFNTWLKDEQSHFLAVNERFATGFGWPSVQSLVGKSDLDITTPELAAQYRADDANVLATGQPKDVEEMVEVKGEMQWHETYKTPVRIDGRVIGTVGFSRDITAIRAHQRQLEQIAHFDSLTALPNRVLLADRLQQALMQCQRRGQMVAVAYLDLDGFKAVNDQYGHDAGDQLLIAVATHMKQALREGDTLARMGGDEFVAVLTDLADAQACVPLLTRLLEAAATPVDVNGVVLQVSASVGVTLYPQVEALEAEQLLRQADQAMYAAKSSGKNRYHFFA
jgi:diguanylate cyclase (GGDEF)-like protein/PAS domain S-box-containing protein